MSMNCLSLIQQHYPSMSAVEKRIADCIMSDPERVMSATMVYVAQKAHVSEGSVVNFSNMLGFKGFSQMKINLARNISSYNIQDEILDEDTPIQVLRKMIDWAKSSFESTADTIGSNLDMAVAALLKADKIISVGAGHSEFVAGDIANRLLRIGLNSRVESSLFFAEVAISQLKENDCVIVVSNSGRTKDVLSLAQAAKAVGAKVISLTSYTDSHLAKISDIVLLSVSVEAEYYREPRTARLTQLMIGDCLVECVSHCLGSEAIVRLDKIAEAYEEHREPMAQEDGKKAPEA